MNLPGIGDAHTLLATDSLVAVLSGPPHAFERVKTRAGITLPKSSLISILIERGSYIYLSTKLWNWVVDSVLRSPLRFLPGLKPPNGNGHKRRGGLATSTWSVCSTNIGRLGHSSGNGEDTTPPLRNGLESEAARLRRAIGQSEEKLFRRHSTAFESAAD
jgi:hypothetical protein